MTWTPWPLIVVAIRNEYAYERSKSAWDIEPIELAPLPPGQQSV
jgi:hypothetical protein